MNWLENTKSSLLKDAVSDPQNTVYAAEKPSPGNRKQSGRNRGHESKQSNQEKASAKQCKFCGTNHPYDRAKCPASGKTWQTKAILPLSVRKRIVSQVRQLTRYITQVQRQDMQKVVNQHVSQHLTLMSLSLSQNVLELLAVTCATRHGGDM